MKYELLCKASIGKFKFNYLNSESDNKNEYFRNIDQKIRCLTDYHEILSDISQLQITPTEKLFKRTSYLFLEKWSYKGHEEFAENFDQSYLKRTNKWAERFSKTCPSTNNGIDS